jgi:hypothetical protein
LSHGLSNILATRPPSRAIALPQTTARLCRVSRKWDQNHTAARRRSSQYRVNAFAYSNHLAPCRCALSI